MKIKTKKGTAPVTFYLPTEVLNGIDAARRKYPYFNRSSFLVKILIDFLEQQKEKEKQGVKDGTSD